MNRCTLLRDGGDGDASGALRADSAVVPEWQRGCMRTHGHRENPWRVRVEDASGRPCGAGVLLETGQHVLTCAHVVADAGAAPGGAPGHVGVRSTVCRPEWSTTGRVEPGSWRFQEDTQRGDVALIHLDEPAPCDGGTRLWRAPMSKGKVRAYGFPHHAERGLAADAELGGSGYYEGEWVQLDRLNSGRPWIQPGFSGAGVVAGEGAFADRVIGIVVADHIDGDAKAAWMLPTETALVYLPDLKRYVDGAPATCLPPPDGTPPHHGLDDPLRLALTREVARVFGGYGRAGTTVLTGGATTTGTSWLARLVRTADPVARAGTSDHELSTAPRDTVLRVGAVDAAYDAQGKTSADVRRYLAERFGFPHGDADELLDRLRHRESPACLVIAGVDRSAEPNALLRDLLVPLAETARRRRIRLILGFDGRLPSALPYDIALDSDETADDMNDDPPRPTSYEDACETVERLAEAEDEAADIDQQWGLRFKRPWPPSLPPCHAPQLRVRLAVARGPGAARRLAGISAAAQAARGEAVAYVDGMRRLVRRREDLETDLELHRLRAGDVFDPEDEPLVELHDEADLSLSADRVDLPAAAAAVRAFQEEVHRRIEERRRDDGEM